MNGKLLIGLLSLVLLPCLSRAQDMDWGWNPDQKSFNLNAPGLSPIALEGVGGSVVINGKTVFLKDARHISSTEESTESGSEYRVEYLFPEINCQWIWTFVSHGDGIEISAGLKNVGNEALSIESWDVVNMSETSGGSFTFGVNPGNARFFGWRTWTMRVELLGCEDGHHHSDNICLLFDPSSKQSFMSAFTSMDRMSCNHKLFYSPTGGISEYRATCHFGKYELGPGQEFNSEKLHISFQKDPYKALENWAQKIYDDKKPGFAELAPVGLGGGSWIDTWNEHEGGYSEVALENVKALRNKLKGFDAEIFRISTWNSMKDGIPGNWMKANEPHFSYTNGFKNFIKELNNYGLKAGVWSAPFWFCSEAEGVLEKNQENLLRNCEGEPLSNMLNWAGNRDDTTRLSRLHRYYLDGTHPKTKEFVKEVFAYNREIGIRFYMLDFLAVPENTCLYDGSQTPLEAAGNILKIIRETAGDDTHLQTAVSSTPAYSGIIDAARVGRDYGESRPLQGQGTPLSDWGNAMIVLHDHHYANPHWLVQNAAASYFTHRKMYINDINAFTIDKPIPLELARITTTMFGLCGSPLMFGDDFRRIDDERLRMAKLCLPRTKGWPIPIDLFDNVYPNDYSRYLKLPVETSWGNYQLLAVFNNDETAYDAVLDFGRLGLDKEKSYCVYEFWTQEYCGTFVEGLDYIIPPNSCRLFRISEAREHPWLLSSDMHIQQGAVEVENLEWDEERMCLSGTATRPVGETGNLLFLMPRNMRVLNNKGLWLMKELEDYKVIIRKQIVFDKEKEDFELFFENWEERKHVPGHLMHDATVEEWLNSVKKDRKPGDTRVIK